MVLDDHSEGLEAQNEAGVGLHAGDSRFASL
jgi:hypothetical protein